MAYRNKPVKQNIDFIEVKGARVHNLKNINVKIPRNKLVVITGLSGSGKSSLAFDTIYAEGQRRYVESLSSYARQFLGVMDKPDADRIDGLSPAISIDQKSISHNPRSTVGTVTEIYDYLRLLYARIGVPHCPKCKVSVESQTVEQIIEKIIAKSGDKIVYILAPIIKDKKGEHKKIFSESKKVGFKLVRVDGDMISIDEAEDLSLDKKKKHSIDLVIDKLKVGTKKTQSFRETIETALDLGNGVIYVVDDKGNEDVYSQHFACHKCGMEISELEPRNFSFNSPHGACHACTGLGIKLEADPELIIPNKKLTIAEGAIRPWQKNISVFSWYMKVLDQVAKEYGFSLHTPIQDLSKKHLDIVLYGLPKNKKLKVNPDFSSYSGFTEIIWEGVVPSLEKRYHETDSDYVKKDIERYMREKKCAVCKGRRLKDEVLGVEVAGFTIDEIVNMPIEKLNSLFKWLSLSIGHQNKKEKTEKIDKATPISEKQYSIGHQIIKEIYSRSEFLVRVGLGYLTLDRTASSLSGGEAQRIRLATQIGSSLTGVLYILDEPSIGLHQRDNNKLIDTLRKLRDLDNTVIVVEHDEDTIMSADYVIDIGPGAGEKGGEIIASGTPEFIKNNKNSLTGKYLSGDLKIEPPKKYRKGNGKYIEIKGAEEHNLKNINVKIPLEKFVVITGLSGSGKSTLIEDILSRYLYQHFYDSKAVPGKHKQIKGVENIDKVITVDQSPIGRTPRSNPATYTGVFTPIRDLFTQVPEARIRGYKAGMFSFNVQGGRCEACQGDGLVKIEMHFLPDVYVECEECKGKRYNKQVLEIFWKGKNIADMLEMTVEEAMNFFYTIPQIHDKLKVLYEVGLGYIKLGQPATTLSGGEAQRVKLATELSKKSTGKTLYILDEPTTGLHFDDIKRLLNILGRLVDRGNTVLVIEHNLDVIKCADYVIDLGPEGGDKGGEIVAQGTPKEIAKVKKSYTGQFLKKVLKLNK